MPGVKCMDFLARAPRTACPSIIVIFGNEEFLRWQARRAVRQWALGPQPDDLAQGIYSGDDAELRDVLDELATPSLLGGERLVVVEDADDFVSRYRESLEKVVQSGGRGGTLLLEVDTWTATTRLARVVEQVGLAIEAKGPQPWHVPGWCTKWAQLRYSKELEKTNAEWLVELAGTNLGVLDQELGKLATYVGESPAIDRSAISRLVAGVRTESTFKILDLALEGQLPRALDLLDRQLLMGESPVGIIGVFGSQLRRLAQAARSAAAGQPVHLALQEAGVPDFALAKSQGQLRLLGRRRLDQMYRRLLGADRDLKGGTILAPRTVLERFLIDLVGQPRR